MLKSANSFRKLRVEGHCDCVGSSGFDRYIDEGVIAPDEAFLARGVQSRVVPRSMTVPVPLFWRSRFFVFDYPITWVMRIILKIFTEGLL